MGSCLCKDKKSKSSRSAENAEESYTRGARGACRGNQTDPNDKRAQGTSSTRSPEMALDENYINTGGIVATEINITSASSGRHTINRLSSQSSNGTSSGVNSQNEMLDSSKRWIYTLPTSRALIDRLVLETLSVIRTLVDNETEPPPSMQRLHKIADKEDGWLQVVQSMVEVIPIRDPLGPANITLLLDDCPLPTKETIVKLIDMLKLDTHLDRSKKASMDQNYHRNIAIVLGCIAEKLAGPRSIALFTTSTLEYLISNLNDNTPPVVILFSIIALEKFAQTTENKITIQKRLQLEEGILPSQKHTHTGHNKNEDNNQKSDGGSQYNENGIEEDKDETKNPLVLYEKSLQTNGKEIDDDELLYMRRQVKFCSQWCLDNLFLIPDRPYSYTTMDMENINVILNNNDVSEYLKISPNGLEARCDAASFESVRCTFEVDDGVWFYEVLIITAGVMQIGWATKDSKFLNHEGYGIGDDEHSIAFDGCRQLMWHHAMSEGQEKNTRCWRPGDIVGSLLDLNKKKISFYLNGKELPSDFSSKVFNHTNLSGYFAAASFMSFQQCEFNFGSRPFLYYPRDEKNNLIKFQSFNDHAVLSEDEKVILPRHKKLEILKMISIKEDACTLCFDANASVVLKPCLHHGFCAHCANQLEICPMCRATIESISRKTSIASTNASIEANNKE